jgi:hypothetical protein
MSDDYYYFDVGTGGTEQIAKVDMKSIAFIYDGTLESIGDYFLNGCTNLDCDIIIPTTCKTIGNNFLYGDTRFNGNVALPSGTESIGVSFMYQCEKFNKPISIPGSVTTINENFMNLCKKFNSTISLNEGTVFIHSNFLFGGSLYPFNQPIVIPNSVTSIGNDFLAGNANFNSPITLSNSLKQLGNGFLFECSTFNQDVTIPNGMELIASSNTGHGFLTRCDKMVHTVNFGSNEASIFGDSNYKQYHMSAATNDVDCYTNGIKIKGDYAESIHEVLPDKTDSTPFRKLIVTT